MRLVEIDAALKREVDLLTYDAWGGDLTLPQYRERQDLLRAHPWAVKNQRNWALLDENGLILSSCESLWMECQFREDRGTVCAIASVFTPKEMRGRGYAKTLLRAVIANLRVAKTDVMAFILYSEVETRIYESLGFVPVPGACVSLTSKKVTTRATLLPQLSASILPGDARFVRTNASELSIRPTPDQIEYHLVWQAFYASTLRFSGSAYRGAQFDGATILWYRTRDRKSLQILFLSPCEREVAEELLAAARSIAEEEAADNVLLWQSELSGARFSVSEVSVSELQEGVPMVLPIDERVLPDSWSWLSRSTWV